MFSVNPVLRFAKLDDLPDIVAIYNQTIPSRMVTADLEPVSVASRKDWFHQHQSDNYPLWVLEIDGQIAGWLSLSPFKERAAYQHTVEISLYIESSYRGQHLGHYCLNFLETAIENYNFETVVALVFGHNLASQSLFAKHGYFLWGRLPQVARLDDTYQDLLFLGKRYTKDITEHHS